MRCNSYFVACLLVLTYSVAHSQNLLNAPETVVFDTVEDRYFVSDMQTPNYIVEIDRWGSYRVFNNQMNFTHGMLIQDNKLYIATHQAGVPALIALDLTTGERVFDLRNAAWGMPNGLATDTSGFIYLSAGSNSFWRIDPETGEDTLLTAGIPWPNGVWFESENNRVMILSEYTEVPYLYCYDIAAKNFGMVPVQSGRYSGITRDHQNNYYLSAFNQDEVFKYPSTLGASCELVCAAQGPEGICFNQKFSTLVIPNLNSDSLTFIPMNIDLWMSTDTSAGSAPFTVSFAGDAFTDITEWHWDFGDSSSSDQQSPTHIYDIPGMFNVTMFAVTNTNDTLRRTYPNFIHSIGDTVWADSSIINPNQSNEITISIANTAPLGRLEIPVTYFGDLDPVLDSVSTTGCRTESFLVKDTLVLDRDQNMIVFMFKPRASGSPLYLSPGSGPVVKLYISAGNPSGKTAEINLSGDGTGHAPRFYTQAYDYLAMSINGLLVRESCCGIYTEGMTGNTDCDLDGRRNLADITRLIDRVYLSRSVLCCEENGNTDGDAEGKLNLADITRLIDYVYVSKLETALCQ